MASDKVFSYDPNSVYSFTVGSADVIAYRLYKQHTDGTLIIATDNHTGPLFVPQTAEKAGYRVGGMLVGTGCFILTASGSISAGANVAPAANGKVRAAVTGDVVIGKAFNTTVSDGELVSVYTNAKTGVASNTISGAYGQAMAVSIAEEEVTLSTSGSTTDSTANLLPANSLILQVTAYVTTTITTATDWKLGDGSTADRFTDANATLVAGTTGYGVNHWNPAKAAGYTPYQASASKVRITTTGTPGAGKIRVTVHYIQFTAPTS